jgi:KAP family P-loop domain
MGYWDKLRSIFSQQEATPLPDAAPALIAPDESKQPVGPYRTDAPISDPRLDVFDREPFARRIADTIGERNDPSSLVVGIYGPWGDGKTTVLNFIRNRLKDYPSIICVSFNPWRMEGEQALLQGFFATLADVLDKELTTDSEKLGDVLKKYGTLLKIAPGGWGDAAVGAGTALSAVSLDELRDRISTMLREADRRVVIIMDDIDRLDRSEIQAIFRLVKLTGDFENTAYVLAFDEQMVAGAIGEKYASSSGQSYEAGMNFLEKIVQVPLHLPPPSPDALRQYCFGLVDEAMRESGTEMSQSQVDEFVRHFIDGIQIRLKTPRMAKRYANALHFALTILKGETYTTDLLLVEGLRMFYPKLYDAIRHDPEPVLRTHSADKANANAGKFIEAHTEGMTAAEKRAAANLVEALFPRMGSTIIGSDWEAEFARGQRIASNYYFPRYFTYGVSSSDVADVALKSFVAALAQVSAEESAKVFRGLVNDRNASTLLYKLRSQEDQMPALSASRLIEVFARNGSCFPSPDSFVFFMQPLMQAVICIRQLMRRIPAEERLSVATGAIANAETLKFACDAARWLSAGDGTVEPVLTADEEKQMEAALGTRIETYLAAQPQAIWLVEPKDAGTYLRWWERVSGPGPVRAYTSRQVQEDPASVFELMKAYLPNAWGMTTGLPVESSFDRDTYNSISAVIDPATVAATLLSIYGEELSAPNYHLPRREPRERRLAHQFMLVYNKVLAEQAQGAKPVDSEEPDMEDVEP